MLEPEESAELRSLQERAYGRDAALTPGDAARLRELEERRVERVADVPESPFAVLPAPTGDEPGSGRADHAGPVAEIDPAREQGVAQEQLTAREQDPADVAAGAAADTGPAQGRMAWRSVLSLLRGHWRPVAFATAAMLAIGVGVGWLAFRGPEPAPVELTVEQQAWHDELVAGGVYDAGSVRALAVEEGAVIWAATKDARERTCVILGTGEVTVPNCELTETVAETGVYGSITVQASDDLQRQVGVQMLFTASGEPAVAVSSYDYDPGQSGITYANDREADTAKRLADDGFDASSLWVVGYDRDVPVWTAVQTESQNPCLIYDGSTAESPMTCADPQTMQEQSSSLVLSVVDTETGGQTHLELASTQGPGYLVITREGGVSGAGGN
ncbi:MULTISPECIES: hypothetical protein [unclassified Microbacterium]|uniref:hypothetical protein n=1 Tax=unclassified Microbacterium TaxID=2609290 RepID=UPI001604E072|nr:MULTISPECIES: hypothetical protein [unclassified Microbacterium]QNA92038.1 hypothetical protein G4G29_05595 [Microbacterium sp. Se63.02b]QYM65270.1 hypothetical protein K1X59_05625 [Microbacterium sp. Se5.02b]